MADSDNIKNIKKRLLDIEKERDLRKHEEEWSDSGLIGSGQYLRGEGSIEAEFALKKQLIDEGINIETDDNQDVSSDKKNTII